MRKLITAFVGIFSNKSDGSLLEKTPTKTKKFINYLPDYQASVAQQIPDSQLPTAT